MAQVAKLDTILENRARVAGLYNDRLATVDGVETPAPDQGLARRSWLVYPVRLDEGTDRDGISQTLSLIHI